MDFQTLNRTTFLGVKYFGKLLLFEKTDFDLEVLFQQQNAGRNDDIIVFPDLMKEIILEIESSQAED